MKGHCRLCPQRHCCSGSLHPNSPFLSDTNCGPTAPLNPASGDTPDSTFIPGCLGPQVTERRARVRCHSVLAGSTRRVEAAAPAPASLQTAMLLARSHKPGHTQKLTATTELSAVTRMSTPARDGSTPLTRPLRQRGGPVPTPQGSSTGSLRLLSPPRVTSRSPQGPRPDVEQPGALKLASPPAPADLPGWAPAPSRGRGSVSA